MRTPSVNLVVRFSWGVLAASKVAQSGWPHSDLEGYSTHTFSYALTLVYCKLQAKQNTTQTLYLCCQGKVLLVSRLTDSDIFCSQLFWIISRNICGSSAWVFTGFLPNQTHIDGGQFHLLDKNLVRYSGSYVCVGKLLESSHKLCFLSPFVALKIVLKWISAMSNWIWTLIHIWRKKSTVSFGHSCIFSCWSKRSSIQQVRLNSVPRGSAESLRKSYMSGLAQLNQDYTTYLGRNIHETAASGPKKPRTASIQRQTDTLSYTNFTCLGNAVFNDSLAEAMISTDSLNETVTTSKTADTICKTEGSRTDFQYVENQLNSSVGYKADEDVGVLGLLVIEPLRNVSHGVHHHPCESPAIQQALVIRIMNAQDLERNRNFFQHPQKVFRGLLRQRGHFVLWSEQWDIKTFDYIQLSHIQHLPFSSGEDDFSRHSVQPHSVEIGVLFLNSSKSMYLCPQFGSNKKTEHNPHLW